MATTQEIVDLLKQCRDVRRSLAPSQLADDSAAQRYADIAEAQHGSPALAHQVNYVIDLWTLVPGEMIGSIGTLISSDDPVFGIFPICRSVIEHSASVVWILDPDEQPEKIWARAMLASLRTAVQMCQAAARMGPRGNATHQEQRRRLQDLRKQATEAFPEGTDADKNLIAGESMPEPMDILKHYGERAGMEREWHGMYDYLCAVTHPTLASYEYIGSNVDTGSSWFAGPGDDLMGRLIRAIVVPYLKALDHYAAYNGTSREAIDAAYDALERIVPYAPE